MRTIAFLTGSRGEWGYIRPVLKQIDHDPALDYRIIATNMQLLPDFGMAVNEIVADGFAVHERLHMAIDGYTSETMTKSLALLLMELPGALRRLRPDILVLAGDRGEQLMGAIAAVHMRIPVAHIQAGELSGNVDGIVRHAITKLAHIHFAANEGFADRVRRMGEQPFRVFNTGAPQLDEVVQGEYTPLESLNVKYALNGGPLILAVQHSVTEEEEDAGWQVQQTVRAISEVGCDAIMIYPNCDAGSSAVRRVLATLKGTRIRLYRNLPRADYLGLMRRASIIVGNSSSGILEAPSFRLPCVNIGRRQLGRPQACNVINVHHDASEIAAAMRRAMSDEFQKMANECSNPYGDGRSAARIVHVLKTIEIDSRLLNKEMAY